MNARRVLILVSVATVPHALDMSLTTSLSVLNLSTIDILG